MHLRGDGSSYMGGWRPQHVTSDWIRVIENGPFDVLFGRNLLSLPAIKYFRDDGIDDTPILLEQSDISVGQPLSLQPLEMHELTGFSPKNKRPENVTVPRPMR